MAKSGNLRHEKAKDESVKERGRVSNEDYERVFPIERVYSLNTYLTIKAALAVGKKS